MLAQQHAAHPPALLLKGLSLCSWQKVLRSFEWLFCQHSLVTADLWGLPADLLMQASTLANLPNFPPSAIELEYSVDLGITWHPILRDCLPTNVECNRYHLQRILISDTFNKWTRITLPLPPYTRYILLVFCRINLNT